MRHSRRGKKWHSLVLPLESNTFLFLGASLNTSPKMLISEDLGQGYLIKGWPFCPIQRNIGKRSAFQAKKEGCSEQQKGGRG